MTATHGKLLQWAGLAAIVAGLSYVVVGLFHPVNALESATTTIWAVVHVFACAFAYLGIFGLVGLHVGQAGRAGWLGLAGFVLLVAWLGLVLCFSFIEVAVLPWLAPASPRVVEGFMAMFTVPIEGVDLGPLPTLWLISGPLYILGGVLFGIAAFRAGVLPRWAGALLAAGTAIAPAAALLPFEYQTKITIPVGLALAWMGYALWTGRAKGDIA